VQYPAEITNLTGPVTGSITGNTICIDLPLNAFGATRPIGNPLYNVAAFSGGRNNVAADVYTEGDSTRSFDFTLGNITTTPLVSVVSRKVHGPAGIFDINLPLAGPRGIECRSPGSTGDAGVDYKMIFSFSGLVASCGSTSTGSLVSGPAPNQCTVNLTGVPNAQFITVKLTGVSVPTACPAPFVGNAFVTMGVLVGDVDASGQVNSTDVSTTKFNSGQAANSGNFRTDVVVNGLVNSSDVSQVKSKSGTGLPPSAPARPQDSKKGR
jgi:hypothetical protein